MGAQSGRSQYLRISQRVVALAALLFGIATIFAGTRVLLGSDPGYVVFLPLLLYNTAMGFAYVGVGAVTWRNLCRGKNGAGAVFLLNLLVLAAIGFLYTAGGPVAIESLRAMTLRTVVWFVLFVGLWWLGRAAAEKKSQGSSEQV